MMGVRERLAESGMTVPVPPSAVGSYVPAVRVGDLVFTAGQLPMSAGSLAAVGKVDGAVSVDAARGCAAQAALNALGAASTVCDLDDVVGVVKVVGYVASAPGFTGHSSIIDAASAVMTVAFGDAGRHARESVGVASLPLDAPVEVSLVLRVLS